MENWFWIAGRWNREQYGQERQGVNLSVSLGQLHLERAAAPPGRIDHAADTPLARSRRRRGAFLLPAHLAFDHRVDVLRDLRKAGWIVLEVWVAEPGNRGHARRRCSAAQAYCTESGREALDLIGS
jgi:hypothetical protein